MKQSVLHFVQLTRPLFLMGGILLYLLGVVSAALAGYRLGFWEWLIGQLMVTFIQLMTHYANEYYDVESDRLNMNRTWFSGGSGVLARGALAPAVARNAAWVMGGAGLMAAAFAAHYSTPALLLGLLALAAAWSYSGPPLRLVRTGWGEFSASLVVAGMVPLVGFAMQAHGPLPSRQLLAVLPMVLPLVLIHFAMLVAFQIPDRLADEASGKRTLCVRLGIARTALVHNLALAAAFAIIGAQAAARNPGAGLALLVLPLALWQAVSVQALARQHPSAATPVPTAEPSTPSAIPVSGAMPPLQPLRYHGLTTRALGIFAASTTLWLVGLVLLWIQ